MDEFMLKNNAGYVSSTRSAVLTQGGLVCSASPLAGSIGANVLKSGGNAFDAAIAVAAAEAVVLPPMCGIGGEVFALLYESSSGKVYDITGSGRAPKNATAEYFTSKGYTKMPPEGPLTPTVPGELHAWQTILEQFGTQDLANLIAPAIRLADQGFPLPGRIGTYFEAYKDKISNYPSTKKIYLNGDSPFVPGDLLVQKDLAETLRRISSKGIGEFYQGALAEEIADAIISAGGLMTSEDLAGQKTVVTEAKASTNYRGNTVFASAPPSQGYMLLEVLNILENYDLRSMGWGSAESIHLMVEALKLGFIDRLHYLGDPDFIDVPLNRIISKEYAKIRSEGIDPKFSSNDPSAGTPDQLQSGTSQSTSYFNVIDSQGNCVSFIHSLSQYFGSGFVAGNTGVLLNDRAGRGFYLVENHPNVIAPLKRSMNTIQAYMVIKDGRPILVGGTPGGDRQPSWNIQMITALLDYGVNVQAAADTPRWHHFPGSDPATSDLPFELRFEEGFDDETLKSLSNKGHDVKPVPEGQTPGAVQLIQINPLSNTRIGGTDRRSDGYPMPE